MKAEDTAVILGPVIHPAQLDVADHVVNAKDSDVVAGNVGADEAGEKWSGVILVGDERVNRVAVGVDGGAADFSVLVGEVVRLLGGCGAALDGLGEGQIGVFDLQADIAHTVAVAADMLAGSALGVQGRGQKDVGLALAQKIRSGLAVSGLQSTVGHLRKAEGVAIIKRRLAGVADIELDVMDSLQLKWILHLAVFS